MVQAFIALGSNLANPIQQIKIALSALDAIPQTTLVKQSSFYQTAPIGYDAHAVQSIPDFINAVAEVSTTLSPSALLAAILEVENKSGRERPYRNAPRVLDCDLLLYGDEIVEITYLTIPHPRMHERGFVLLPLFEIAPQLTLPKHGKIADLINPEISHGVQKISI